MGEQLVELEPAVVRRRVVRAVAPPLLERAVPRELEVVAVWVAQIDGEMRAVIRELPQWNACVNEAADGLRELRLRGEVERHVMQPRDAVRLRRPVG
jgi:hypothetical protein